MVDIPDKPKNMRFERLFTGLLILIWLAFALFLIFFVVTYGMRDKNGEG